MPPVHTRLLHIHVSTCANTTRNHPCTHACAHTHPQFPHGHSWQTLDICEGSIQRPFRILGPLTLMESMPGAGRLPTPHFWQVSGAPLQLPPGPVPPFPLSSIFSLTSLPHATESTSHTDSFQVFPHLGAQPPRLSVWEGRDCAGLVHGTCPAPGAWQTPSGVGWKRNKCGMSSLGGTRHAHLHVHTIRVCSSVLTHTSHTHLHTCERALRAHTCLPVSRALQMESIPLPRAFAQALVA